MQSNGNRNFGKTTGMNQYINLLSMCKKIERFLEEHYHLHFVKLIKNYMNAQKRK